MLSKTIKFDDILASFKENQKSMYTFLIKYSYVSVPLGLLKALRLKTCRVTYLNCNLWCKLRLGAQSVTLLSTLRDPTQLRRCQCATRQNQPP